jgi:hypothetical protein
MPRRPTFLAREFSKTLAQLDKTRVKVEDLFTKGLLDRDDAEAVYAGLYLEAFTSFEALVERLFLGIFDGSIVSVTQPAVRKFRVTPKAQARDVVFAHKTYVDWLPVQDHLLPRARKFLDSGKPFENLTEAERKDLKDAHLLRNALAHKSDAATKGFEDTIKQLTLLQHERRPTGYLRSCPQGPGTPTLKMNMLVAVIARLCA